MHQGPTVARFYQNSSWRPHGFWKVGLFYGTYGIVRNILIHSLSFLANRLGGLQVMLPGETEWKYVKVGVYRLVCNHSSPNLSLYVASSGPCYLQHWRRFESSQWWHTQIKHSPCPVSGRSYPSSLSRQLTVLSSPPPLAQSHYERWSLVYFTRPGDSVPLRALVEESSTIARAVEKDLNHNYDPGVTAAQWFTRRQSKWRGDNQKVSFQLMPRRGWC